MDESKEIKHLKEVFEKQNNAYELNPMPDAFSRISKLKAVRSSLLENKERLLNALNKDFGRRAEYESLFCDIMAAANNLSYCASNVKKWMRPSRRKAGMQLSPAKVTVEYQPLGVVGIIVPWNFPVMLSLGPMAFALAAGNRVMIKMSESTPETNKVITDIVALVLSDDEVAVFEGGPEIGEAFSHLKFGHLLFTGSSSVGRKVMRAAAANLVPVTLELGGKSPVIIDRDMPIETAVERLMFGKCMNSGQICTAPDYVLLPRERMEAFVEAYLKKFKAFYDGKSNDITSLIDEKHYNRLLNLLKDAGEKGAEIVDAAQGDDMSSAETRIMSTRLIVNADESMKVMDEEIFGPLLPLVAYDSINDAISFVKKRPRPLALYIMSFDKNFQKRVLKETHSGGVCVNDTVMHVAVDDAPFGGTGDSGMGYYHGREGFLAFSHARTVFRKGRYFYTGRFIHPPYGRLVQKILLKLFLR